MKIAIIGAGNMGGAIGQGLIKRGVVAAADLTVADPSQQVRDNFTSLNSAIETTDYNLRAAALAQLIIVAVKPWMMEQVLMQISEVIEPDRQIVASVAAGISFEQLDAYLGGRCTSLMRIMPNTPIALGLGTTFIASQGVQATMLDQIKEMFDSLGKCFVVDEQQMTSVTALASCGIAYALRYIDAAARGGEELGIPYGQAQQIVASTMQGALALLAANGSTPQQEIDRVTTPGGITLRGLQEMERMGFSNAVIAGLKASK